MWLSTWSLQEFSWRTAKLRCGGDHNSWEAETVIILLTSSSARWLGHIFNDWWEIQHQAPIRRADWMGLLMVYYRIQAHWKYNLAALHSLLHRGSGQMKTFTYHALCPGSQNPEHRSDWDPMKPSKKQKTHKNKTPNQNKKQTKHNQKSNQTKNPQQPKHNRTRISHFFCDPVTGKKMFFFQYSETFVHRRTTDKLVLKWTEDVRIIWVVKVGKDFWKSSGLNICLPLCSAKEQIQS